MGYTQAQVAADLNFGQPTISQLENGQNDSARILMWYVAHGFILKIHVEGRDGVVM
jgi:transcriptional regulator with XRE-family HTH domain